MEAIAHIHTVFGSKFAVPRQAGLVDALSASIVFTPAYRNPDALRGLEGFSHIWLLWGFSENRARPFSPTVRPPRLGGNTRLGVFATRSPYRPNPIGLSCVRLLDIALYGPQGPVLQVAGADMVNGTPIYDIKPYLAYTDSHPEARGGFTQERDMPRLAVDFPPELLAQVAPELRAGLCDVLAADPRPRYQNDPERVYGFRFSCWEIRFFVDFSGLHVTGVERINEKEERIECK